MPILQLGFNFHRFLGNQTIALGFHKQQKKQTKLNKSFKKLKVVLHSDNGLPENQSHQPRKRCVQAYW